MAGCVNGLIDAQGIVLNYRKEGATAWTQLLNHMDVPLPGAERDLDDITDDTTLWQQQVVAGVIKQGAFEFTLPQRTDTAGSAQQVTLKTMFISGECVEWQLLLPDEAETSYEFCASISKFSPGRARSQKNRIAVALAMTGEVVEKRGGTPVLPVPTTP